MMFSLSISFTVLRSSVPLLAPSIAILETFKDYYFPPIILTRQDCDLR